MSQVDFTSADVRKNLIRFSIPMLLLSILDYLAVFVDLSWLLAMSELQQLPTSLKLSFTVVGLLEAVLAGTLSAVYIYANQAYGNKDFKAAQHLINYGFGIALLIGLFVGGCGLWFGDSIVAMFGVEEMIQSQTVRYLDIFWYGYPIILLYIYSGLIAKMSGNLSVIIKFRVATFFFNLALTPIFILYGQAHNLDLLQMAALSTILSRALGLVLVLYLVKRHQVFPFKLAIDFFPKPVFKQWKAMYKLGGAETINSLSLSLSFFLFFLAVSYFQPGVFETVTVAQYMTGFFHSIFLGVLSSLIPFTAQNAGNKNLHNIDTGVEWMTRYTFLACLVVVLPYMLFSSYFAQLFVSDPRAIADISTYVYFTAIPWAFLIASFPYIFAIIGLGDTKGTLWLTIWSMYIANLLPLILVLNFVGDSLVYVALAEGGAHILTFFGCRAYYLYRKNKISLQWQPLTNTPSQHSTKEEALA
ncbi:MATE family efflux transporter [Pseudoalteromonas fenneropenaei]|uniref:MATE family efflux transporter n=1 Tax=Pseudoalteromonas fenneropenaei TaxID=1737459 RepID=A0ABV7CL78_9GAMM